MKAKGWLGKVEELRPFKPALGEAFAERVLSDDPISNDQIRTELEKRYSLVIDQEIPEVLQDLVEMGKAEKIGNKHRRIPKKIG